MEFIPLERPKNKKKAFKKQETENIQKLKKNEIPEEVIVKKTKPKLKDFGKKNVKNKYKETLALKQEKAHRKKLEKRKKEKEIIAPYKKKKENEEEEEMEDDDEAESGDEEKGVEENEEDEARLEEEAFKRKCKEMDEKKKNRLFVKLKKKIYSEAQIKELHPDIKQVIFPRKKNSRWCWAVFVSEESANNAMKELVKNKDIFVSKPNPYDRVHKKMKERMKTVLLKKEKKKKLQKLWM